MELTKEEKLRGLWLQIRQLNQDISAIHREINRVELGLPTPYALDKDWVPPFLRQDTCIPSRKN